MSVALITSAGIFAQSIRELGEQNIRNRFGNYYASAERLSQKQVDKISRHVMTDTVGTSIPVGTAGLAADLSLFLEAPDEMWTDLYGFDLEQGRFPEKAGEIVIEKWLFKAAGIPAEIGASVQLSVEISAPDETGRDSTRMIERQFTVVGYLVPNHTGITSRAARAFISQSEAENIIDDTLYYRTAFTTKKEFDPQAAIKSVAGALGLDPEHQLNQNTALLGALGSSRLETVNDALLTVELIVAVILVIATVAVIYNSFAISVMERIRQFGILRTIGATRRQIRRLVFRQAGLIAAIGIPAGLGVGILAVQTVIKIFNGFSGNIGFSGVAMTYPPEILIGGPLIGLVSVFISALLPAKTAGKVSPLEAVLAEGRFVKDRIKRRRSIILGTLFGVPGKIASQNLRRHPGRFVVTVFSIGLGIALFTTFAGFFSILSAASTNVDDEILRGQISVVARRHEPDPISLENRMRLAHIPGVREINGLYEAAVYMVVPEEFREDLEGLVPEEIAEETQKATGLSGPVAEVSLLALEPAMLNKLRTRILSGWRSPDELAAMEGVYVPDGLYKAGESFPVMLNGERIVLTAAGIADSLPPGNINHITIAAPLAYIRNLTGRDGFTGLELYVEPEADTGDIVRAAEALLEQENDVMVIDMTKQKESAASITKQFSILLYGLVAVVSLIGALNIINTIATNLILRIREFGTLRAVGMSGRQMKFMIRIEAVLYGIWALLWGGTVGVILTRLMYSNVMQIQAIPWQFPWMNLFVSGTAAVILGLFSSAVPMKRVTEMNIIESIRTIE
jgi:putative ABC transport system permease protein